MRIDLGYRNNFKQEFQEGRFGTPHLNKVVWTIISLIVGVLMFWNPLGWAAWAVFAVSLAWTVISITVNLVWSNYDRVHAASVARKERARLLKSLGTNVTGRLVNTRQSNDPIRVLYGLVKTGGVWVYSKASRINDSLLNVIVTWSEGEISGIATGIDNVAIFSGTTTLNDLHPKGEFAYAGGCTCDMMCNVYSTCSCDMTSYSA